MPPGGAWPCTSCHRAGSPQRQRLIRGFQSRPALDVWREGSKILPLKRPLPAAAARSPGRRAGRRSPKPSSTPLTQHLATRSPTAMSHWRTRLHSPRTLFDPPGAGHLLQPCRLCVGAEVRTSPACSHIPARSPPCQRPLPPLVQRGGDTLQGLPDPCVCFRPGRDKATRRWSQGCSRTVLDSGHAVCKQPALPGRREDARSPRVTFGHTGSWDLSQQLEMETA